ncbi:MAG: BspA family leucine-rich repeat surface protein [Ruminococcus sp.]|uniref:BspA family leucine-rich repeat surface protein n=1 Tax=Ruminococcus sp. TaxID=41978 RepID=UPI0025FEFB99|nr:BspA family leucine-rich repeat surface protein [Ruminococcus sp.]MCR4795060.1 BspA family leucine-rich repeat surface protein [Ruminococcus sp.]
MKIQKLTALVMAFTVSCGVIETVNNYSPVSFTASAEEQNTATAVFDSKTSTLTLSGNVVKADVLKYLESGVKSVVAEEGTVLPENCSEMFRRFQSAETIDLSKADTSKVTNMSGMFSECIALKTLDVSGFDTSNVTDMSSMFSECLVLESLDVSRLNTSKVTDMSTMFLACRALKTIDVSGFDTSAVKDMQGMFNDCMELASLDLSKFNTSNVTNMRSMFYGCRSLISLDLSAFDTSNAENMCGMFGYCDKLEFLKVSSFNTSKVNDMEGMFYQCNCLKALDLHSFDTSKVKGMNSMFSECKKLSELDVSSFDTANVEDMTNMFWECDALTNLDLSGFDTSGVKSMRRMFGESNSLKNLDISGFSIKKDCEVGAMFTGCASLETVYVGDGWKIENIADKVSMFDGCISIVGGNGTVYDENKLSSDYAHIDAPDAPGYFTSAEASPRKTAVYDEETGTLTLRGNVNKNAVKRYRDAVTVIAEEGAVLPEDCSFLFNNFSRATTIDLTKADTSKIMDMEAMFMGCRSLRSIDLSKFIVPNASCMKQMFYECEKLESIDLSGIDTSDVKLMTFMFAGCSSLETVDISGFNTVNVYSFSRMFYKCSNLKTVYVGEKWITDGAKADGDGLFEKCEHLVGGNGTKYDADKISIDYARVDVPDAPGYFSVHEGASYETPAELKSTRVTEGKLTYRVFADHAEVLECDKKAEGEVVIADKINGVPVTKIAPAAFGSCFNVKSVVMADTVKVIGDAAFVGSSLDSIKLSDSLEVIGDSAFVDCKLTGIEFPDTLKSIGAEAFTYCPLKKEVVIPASVEQIKTYAFAKSGISNITVLNPDCEISNVKDTIGDVRYIKGHKGSTAQAYADRYDIKFIDIDEKLPVWGDANWDGGVDMADIVLIMQSLANPNKYGLEGTDEHHITVEGQTYADVSRGSQNEANGITGEDALLIQRYLLGEISSIVPKMP